MEDLIAPLVIGELLGMLVLVFKTYPSMQAKVKQLEEGGIEKDKKIALIERGHNDYNVELNKFQVEMGAFRREYNDNKEDMKEILKELRKALDDQSKTMAENSRAISNLEVTIKHFSNTIGNSANE